MGTRTTFHKDLQEVEDGILTMGSMVGKAIDRAIEALKKRDLALAHQIIADDAPRLIRSGTASKASALDSSLLSNLWRVTCVSFGGDND